MIGKISGSLNQIAKRINSTGNVYEEDMKEVKGIMDEVWRTQKAMLRKQPLIMEAKQAELCEEQLACGMDENVEVNAESDNKIEGVPDISEDENVIDNTENTKKDTPYSEALETEKKVLKEMIELEKKHFGELKKTVKIDVSL